MAGERESFVQRERSDGPQGPEGYEMANIGNIPASVNGRTGNVGVDAGHGTVTVVFDKFPRGTEPAARLTAVMTPSQAVVMVAALGAAIADAKRS